MRRDRSEAAATDSGDAGPLGGHTAAGLGIVHGRRELLLACPHLERDGALTGLRDDLLRIEPMTDLGAEAEPVEPGRSEHDSVEPPLVPLPQARVDVAAKRLDGKPGLEREKLCAPANRGRADPHAGPEHIGTAERVA